MKTNLTKPVFLTVPDAAKICGVSRNTVFLWVRNGRLRAYQTPGRTNQVRPSDLVLFMNDNGMFVPPDLKDLAEQDKKITAATVEATAGELRKILIVDDEPTIRAMISRALKEIGATHLAETGYEALHILTLHPEIRIVLLDLHMPGQHGLNTLKEMRAARPDVPVIIVTGYDAEIPPQLLAKGSGVQLIKKPFALEELRKVVADVLAATPA